MLYLERCLLRDSEHDQIDAIIAMVEADSGRVEVQGDTIIVTLPGTSFRVTYRKPDGEPGLVASDIVREPRMSIAEQTKFLTNAWLLANRKARQIGWTV